MNRRTELLHDLEEGTTFEVEKTATPVAFPLGVQSDRQGPVNDEALRLVHQVFLTRAEHPPSVVVFAGMNHGNGCSEICRSVAEALAADPLRSVCLVEANFRTPAMSGWFGGASWSGLTDALIRKGAVRSFMRPVGSRGNLWLLPCGTTDASSPGLLSSGSLQERIEELRLEFDYVIIDTPPVSRYADAIALGQLADGLVLVVEEGVTRRDATIEAVANLRASKIAILAAVLNKGTSPIPGKILDRL